MALMKSAILQSEDVFRENVDFYRKRIVLAKKMKQLLQTRLYLSRTIREARARPSLHANLTKLELGLMEATNSYLKLVMERQLLNVAVQKSVQSTILYVANKNFFSHPDLNYIEATVAEQMKLMLGSSRLLCSLKETTDRQCVEIKTRRAKLTARFSEHTVKLAGSTRASFNDPDITSKLHKKIRNINLLSTLISTFVAHNATVDSCVSELVLLVRKWRTPRTFEYYKKKCAS